MDLCVFVSLLFLVFLGAGLVGKNYCGGCVCVFLVSAIAQSVVKIRKSDVTKGACAGALFSQFWNLLTLTIGGIIAGGAK